jgi:hypothetical protein
MTCFTTLYIILCFFRIIMVKNFLIICVINKKHLLINLLGKYLHDKLETLKANSGSIQIICKDQLYSIEKIRVFLTSSKVAFDRSFNLTHTKSLGLFFFLTPYYDLLP